MTKMSIRSNCIKLLHKEYLCTEQRLFLTIPYSQLLVLFLLMVQSISIFGCKEYNQYDFGVGHLVMESSLVLLEEGIFYDQCVLLAKFYQPLPRFILYKAKFACYSRCFLTSYFCIPVPYNEKDIFWVLVLKGLAGLHRIIQLQLLQHYWLGHRLGLLWY